MSLENKVMTSMKEAMKSKNQVALTALRAVKAAILNAKTEKGASDVITEEKEVQIVTKMVKQRKDSLSIFTEQNRPDLADKEAAEIAILEQFLPEQLSDDEVAKIVAENIAKTGASSMKDMGKVIGMTNKQLAGKADGKLIADLVKKLLA